MINLNLQNDVFSPLTDKCQVETLIQRHYDDVVLHCNEPYYKTGGELEKASAEYITKHLPQDYSAQWDQSTIGYREQNNPIKELPRKISELRFRVLLSNNIEQ